VQPAKTLWNWLQLLIVTRANLTRANLTGADLGNADLSNAKLTGAKGLPPRNRSAPRPWIGVVALLQ
jgi:hypothetical protein